MDNISAYISYLTFGFGLLIYKVAETDGMAVFIDDIYDYCVDLANDFYKGDFDDEETPVNECLENYVKHNITTIKEWMNNSYMNV